jgi:hypothetical protein
MYEEAAAFVYFFRLTPDQFWDLDMPMYRALGALMKRQQEAQENATRKARGDTTLAAMAARAGKGS